MALQNGDIRDVEILFAHQRGDLDIQLFAEGQYSEPISRAESRTDNERISYQVESTGTYYLLVFDSQSGQNSYRMRMTVGNQNCEDECDEEGQKRCEGDGYQVCGADHDGDDCLEWGPVVSCNGLFCQNGECVDDCTDDYEPNNSLADANEFAAGSVGGLRICPDDEDWYQVQLDAGASVQVEIIFEHADGDLDMGLYDVDSSSLGSSTSTNNREEISHTASSAGAFYIKVYGYSNAQNVYSLSVSVEGGGGDPCNDLCTTVADRRCQGDGFQLCGNYDADPCLEWGEVNSCNGQECQDGHCVDSGDCTDDSFEDNDSSANARALEAGSHSSLQICVNDDDWYSV